MEWIVDIYMETLVERYGLKAVIQVPMEQELLARLDQRAKAEAVSRAALIRNACKRYLRQIEDDELDARYEEGYRRIPDEITEEETLAWLAAAESPDAGWPQADLTETQRGAR